jgi:hypothetical protein
MKINADVIEKVNWTSGVLSQAMHFADCHLMCEHCRYLWLVEYGFLPLWQAGHL